MAKSRKTLIHIGLHKTGSTLLQKSVFPHLKQWFLMTRPYTIFSSELNELQFGYPNSKELQKIRDRILEKFHSSKKGSLLLSDEALSGLPLYGYKNRITIASRLQSIFPEAEILIVLRNQKDLIHSLYKQSVSSGWYSGEYDQNFLWFPGEKRYDYDYYLTHSEDYDENKSPKNYYSKFQIEDFDYRRLLSLYSTKFKKVHVLLYEELLSSPDQFVSRLENILEEHISTDLFTEKINKTKNKSYYTFAKANNISKIIHARKGKHLLTTLLLVPWVMMRKKHRKADMDMRIGHHLKDSNSELYKNNIVPSLEEYADKYMI